MTAPRTGERRRAAVERKQQIIDVAAALFYEKSYLATSLDDIAERIGFTKPAIYYYFQSKDDILFAIVDRIVDDGMARIRSISQDTASSICDRLHRLLIENTRVILENLEANTVFYNSRGLLTPAREQDVRRREKEYTRIVSDLYAAGVKAGELRDVGASLAAATLLGASIWTYRWYDPAGSLSRERIAQDVAGLLMAGFRVEPSAGR